MKIRQENKRSRKKQEDMKSTKTRRKKQQTWLKFWWTRKQDFRMNFSDQECIQNIKTKTKKLIFLSEQTTRAKLFSLLFCNIYSYVNNKKHLQTYKKLYMNKSPGIEVLYCIYSEQLLYIQRTITVHCSNSLAPVSPVKLTQIRC